jgi:hypothetical protein
MLKKINHGIKIKYSGRNTFFCTVVKLFFDEALFLLDLENKQIIDLD